MYLSDEQLMLIEQVTYINPELAEAAGVDDFVSIENCKSLSEFLNQFDNDKLMKLDGSHEAIDGAVAEANEWAAVIRAIKNDPDLMSLQVSDAYSVQSGKTAAICFKDPEEPDKAIVAFRGTLDGDEWEDNVEGLNVADTESQKEALNYIEGLPYDDITVVGHSKGGNKAMYVTVCSDKVKRCVSMDGQGFSQEFIDKYSAEIQEKGGAIKNYSLRTDFVHILLFPVPGSSQIYCEGFGTESFAENHSPNSFFNYTQDGEGRWVLEYDGDNVKIYDGVSENSAMTYLHEFTCFILNVMPKDKQDEVIDYLGNILKLAMGEDGVSIEVDGVVYTKDDLMKYICSKPEIAAMVLAYLIKYVSIYNLTTEEIQELLRALGLGEIEIKAILVIIDNLTSPTGGTVEKIYAALGTSIGAVLIDKWLRNNADISLLEFLGMVTYSYANIGEVDEKSANANASVKAGKTRDFSKDIYDLLLSTISNFEANTFGDVSSWSNYASEEWYSSLGISIARNGINKYINRLTDINSTCKKRIETVFSNEWAIDNAAATKIQTLCEELGDSLKGLAKLAERLSI